MTAVRTPLNRAEHALLGFLVGVAFGLTLVAFVALPIVLIARCW